MNSRLISGLAIFTVAAIAAAALDGGYTIKYADKVGAVHKYKFSGTFSIGGQTHEVTADLARKVTEIEPTGNFSVEEKQTNFKLDGTDANNQSSDTPDVTTYSPKGEIVTIKGDSVDGNSYRFSEMLLFIVPDGEVKAGDKWSYDIKEDKAKGVMPGKATYTLVGEEKVGSVDTLKIKYLIKETASDGASSDGTVWLDKSDFSTVKNKSTWTNVPAPGQSAFQLSGDITVTVDK